MDKILELSYLTLFKQLKKNFLPLAILAIILLLINSYLLLNIKFNKFKAVIDFYPLQEFSYSDLWLLQQQFVNANQYLEQRSVVVGKTETMSPNLTPQFMFLNELSLFKFYKDHILMNKTNLINEVSKNLNIEDGFSVFFNDM